MSGVFSRSGRRDVEAPTGAGRDGTGSGHRCGVVAILGRANVGKSTLLNAFLKTKVAIVTPKPQTTRDRILGILTRPGFQVLFQDTPGYHEPHRALNRRMVSEALHALADCDVALAVSDAREPETCLAEDGPIMERAVGSGRPLLVAINKVDQVAKPALLPLIEAIHRRWSPQSIVPISALTGDGLEVLLREVVVRLPEGPPLYPADLLSDRPVRFLVAEIIREKIFLFTHQEVPYSTAVRVEAFEEPRARRPGTTRIAATIVVERPSQKRIVVGKAGEMIRRIGTAAREDIEALLAPEGTTGGRGRARVFLQLFVRVDEDWSRTDGGVRKVEG